MNEDNGAKIQIERPIYRQECIRRDFHYEKTKINCMTKVQKRCSDIRLKNCVLQTIPAISWLPQYEWKKDFLSDLVSGITVAIMHIPQGMAYGLLGNVPPITGIYMAFFPVLIYFFLGTSRHTSMGTFAIVCLMTGKVVLEYSDFIDNPNTNNTLSTTEPLSYTPVQVASVVTFTVALFQLAMYILRLGFLSVLLSETLVNGFTSAAAVQVIVSQIKDLLGLHIPRHKGYFVVIKTLASVFEEIKNVNYAAIIISAITIIISSLNNEILKPRVARKCSFPIPIELLAIVIGTLLSTVLNFQEVYDVTVVGDIPSGLPIPATPPFALISSILVDSLTIAIVSYTTTLSLAFIFARKLNYDVDANQELLAQGTGNIFGSFFGCMPVTASLSRSMIQQTVGGKSQLASIVSCCILLVVLLWIGPFFEPLPRSVLASVIVVALKGMLMQVTLFTKIWKLSKLDAMVWLSTFLTVILVGIDIGLLVGVVTSLLSIFIMNFKPYTCLLGNVPNTDIYLDINKYKKAFEISYSKIFHYSGSINFATKTIFKDNLSELVKIDPQRELIHRLKLAKYSDRKIDDSFSTNTKIIKLKTKINNQLKCIILDFSCLSYIDPSGVSMLKIVIESFQKIDIPIFIAGCTEPVYEIIIKCDDFFTNSKNSVLFFPGVHDAVKYTNTIFIMQM